MNPYRCTTFCRAPGPAICPHCEPEEYANLNKPRRVDAIAWHGPVAPDTEWHAQLEPFSQVRYEFGDRIRYNNGSAGGTFASSTTILRPERRVGALPVHHVLLPSQPVAIEAGVDL